MDNEKKWRCPINDDGPEMGLDNGDVETFKKEPEASLARETAQNSIDANDGSESTWVEYSLFEVDRTEVPGIEELSKLIENCYEYKKNLPKEAEPLKKMLENSKKEKFQCLRISDFCTTGLEGVATNDSEKPFYLLTKGSGISYKESGSGGSKGIGKYASFVNSNINTVFYSTYNKDKERGYIGISKLRSAPIEGMDGMLSQGIAYYSSNQKKGPILEEFILDKSFARKNDEYGTDIYIVGFDSENNWRWSIISKLLESFMVAFQREALICEVGGIEVSKDTLEEIINDKNLKSICGKILYRDIHAQYALLNDNDVIRKKVSIAEYGDVELYAKKYDAENSDLGTRKCVMVRYPYMKIKLSNTLSKLPFSAMCIIEDNKLNSLLRNVENPQHTDWEFNRLNDDKLLKKETKAAERLLRERIQEFITDILLSDTSDETDVYGAGEFLPSTEEGEENGDRSNISVDIIQPSRIRRNKPASAKKEKINEKNEAFKHKKGDLSDEGADGKPQGTGGHTPPEPNPYEPPNDEGEHGAVDGDKPILKKVKLDGISCRNIVVDEEHGRYDIKFVAPHDEEIFEMELKMCGDGNDTYELDIIDAEVNGKRCEIVDGKVRMSLEKGQSYLVKYQVNQNKMFSSEVLMNAYR